MGSCHQYRIQSIGAWTELHDEHTFRQPYLFLQLYSYYMYLTTSQSSETSDRQGTTPLGACESLVKSDQCWKVMRLNGVCRRLIIGALISKLTVGKPLQRALRSRLSFQLSLPESFVKRTSSSNPSILLVMETLQPTTVSVELVSKQILCALEAIVPMR